MDTSWAQNCLLLLAFDTAAGAQLAHMHCHQSEQHLLLWSGIQLSFTSEALFCHTFCYDWFSPLHNLFFPGNLASRCPCFHALVPSITFRRCLVVSRHC